MAYINSVNLFSVLLIFCLCILHAIFFTIITENTMSLTGTDNVIFRESLSLNTNIVPTSAYTC